jgi:hypothetical protein
MLAILSESIKDRVREVRKARKAIIEYETKARDLEQEKIDLERESKLFLEAAEKELAEIRRPITEERRNLALEKQRIEAEKDSLDRREAELNRRARNEEKRLQARETDVHEYTRKSLLRVDEYIQKKCDSYPALAGMMADFLTLHYEKSARFLVEKPRPAFAEAQRIRELRQETRAVIEEKRILEYKLAYIEKLFPNITDIFDSGFSEEAVALETEEDTDRTRLFVSEEEYRLLSVTDRNQLALDRYIQSRKSRWQVGRDYEMYIGWRLENKGYSVEYTGILEKLEDMGRDLIAHKGYNIYVIQCKNWSQEKTIHEKHIFQLYGTVILYKINNPGLYNVQGTFVTSTKLSETAKRVAEELGIVVYENITLKEFPRIKCNISRSTKEKIYHLPFDQMYDSVVIEEKTGEFYAYTVAEAEEKGFRHAWKHFA